MPSSHRWFISLFHTAVILTVVPEAFGFTYVQTMIILTSAIYDLLYAERNVYYDCGAAIVRLPITLAGWGEALTCNDFLIRWGGHMWFDMSISLSLLAYLLFAHFVLSKEEEKSKKE